VILSLWTAFRALPRGWHYVAAGVVLALAFFVWLKVHDQNTIKEHEQRKSAEIATKAAAATEAARNAIKENQAAIEAGNERARAAASKSADPLRDGLRELRK